LEERAYGKKSVCFFEYANGLWIVDESNNEDDEGGSLDGWWEGWREEVEE
jgi:hypothetical protein